MSEEEEIPSHIVPYTRVMQTCQPEIWVTVDFFPKNSRFFQKTVDLPRKQICMPSAARRNSPKGGFGGASPPGFFFNFTRKWSKSRPPWDFQGLFKTYKKCHFFLTKIWKNIGEQRFMNHFYNYFFSTHKT